MCWQVVKTAIGGVHLVKPVYYMRIDEKNFNLDVFEILRARDHGLTLYVAFTTAKTVATSRESPCKSS